MNSESMSKAQEIHRHNVQLKGEYLQGEEGIDAMIKGGPKDPRLANVRKIKQDLRAEVNAM